MNKIEIYGVAASSYVQTVRLVCGELGLAYELLPIEFKQPSHKALHPFLKMPAMRATINGGDVQLFETLGIVTYLYGQNEDQRLVPGKLLNRCQMYSWISAAIDYYYPTLVRGPLAGAIDMEACGYQLKLLDEQLLQTPYIAGPELSLADLFLFPMVCFIERQAPCDGERPFKALDAWLAALKEREGFAEVTNVD